MIRPPGCARPQFGEASGTTGTGERPWFARRPHRSPAPNSTTRRASLVSTPTTFRYRNNSVGPDHAQARPRRAAGANSIGAGALARSRASRHGARALRAGRLLGIVNQQGATGTLNGNDRGRGSTTSFSATASAARACALIPRGSRPARPGGSDSTRSRPRRSPPRSGGDDDRQPRGHPCRRSRSRTVAAGTTSPGSASAIEASSAASSSADRSNASSSAGARAVTTDPSSLDPPSTATLRCSGRSCAGAAPARPASRVRDAWRAAQPSSNASRSRGPRASAAVRRRTRRGPPSACAPASRQARRRSRSRARTAEHGLALRRYADPTEGARDGLSVSEAHAVAAQDAGLIYLDLSQPGTHAARSPQSRRRPAGGARAPLGPSIRRLRGGRRSRAAEVRSRWRASGPAGDVRA